MDRKRLQWITTIIVTLCIFTINFGNAVSVEALTTDDNSAIRNHPDGLNVRDYFSVDQFSYTSDFPFTKNTAKIYNDIPDLLVLTDGKGTDVTGTYGAIWGNSSKLNYIDINDEQTISAWLYFGPDKTDELKNGHGMTLTLQNDKRKTRAIGMGLQGLGAYAYDKHYVAYATGVPLDRLSPSNEYMMNTTIQNSMSLEFDTQRSDVNGASKGTVTTTNGRSGSPITMINNLGGILLPTGNATLSLNGYDTRNTVDKDKHPASFPDKTILGAEGPYGHIALTYPGKIESYDSYMIGESNNTNLWRGFEKAPSMYHIDPTPANLIDDEDLEGNDLLWHHVTFKWIPHEDDEMATVKYSFNDKNIDGKENFNTSGSYFKRIDKEIVVDPKVFGQNDGKILWGFTGANGFNDEVAAKMVVFESIPAMATGQVEAKITNLDSGKIVTESDNYVPHGANLELNYEVSFVKGRENWKDIIGKIQLPKHVDYLAEGGVIAAVEYEDGTKEDIYSDLNGFLEKIDVSMTKPLGNVGENSNSMANVKIYGIATNDTDQDYVVDEEVAVFKGSNAIASANSPEFIIGHPTNWTLKLDGGGDIELPYKQEEAKLKLPTELSYTNDHKISADDKFNYTLKISDEEKTYDITETVDPDTGKFDIDMTEILGEKFWEIFEQDTTKTITIKATDRDNLVSNEIVYNVKTLPNKLLSLNVSRDLSFESITSFSKDSILNRISDYDVIVNSLKNPWTLSVSASHLVNDLGDVFNGNLIYIQNDKMIELANSYVPILSDPNAYGPQAVPIDITDDWERETGILLQQDGNNQSGKYSGTVSWQVGDYMENI